MSRHTFATDSMPDEKATMSRRSFLVGTCLPCVAGLALPSVGLSAPPAVTFSYTSKRATSIKVGGMELLTGTGIYLIGSKTGKDDPATNFGSPDSNGKRMTHGGPPFQLRFWKKDNKPNTLGFIAEVGPVSEDIETLSMPFDFDQQQIVSFGFDETQYYVNGSYTPIPHRLAEYVRYDSIPQPSRIMSGGRLLGHVGVAKTRKKTSWGRVNGPRARIRVNIDIPNSKHYASLCFHNHFGTHNLELAFGSLKRGGEAKVVGELVVFSK